MVRRDSKANAHRDLDRLRGRPHRHLPQRVAARIADAIDHLAPALLDFFARDAAVLHQRIGVAVAPRFPDAGERVALHAQRIDDDVVGGDVGYAEVVEEREGLASDVEIAADTRGVTRRKPLPEAVRIEIGRMAKQHSVILGDDVNASARTKHAPDLLQHARGIGNCLDQMPADHVVERRTIERKRQRVANLESNALSELRAASARQREMRLLEVDADERRIRKRCGESRGNFAGAASDVEHAAFRRMALENRLLLRPDRLRLRGEVPHHRLVRHLFRLRAARMHGWRFYVARPPLQPELLQVMIYVFVHRLAPLPPRHRTEERVRLFARRLGAAFDELGDQVDELLPLRREVALVSNDERWIRRTVTAERLLAEDRLSEERHQDLADQLLLHGTIARRRLQSSRAMRDHLRGIHLSPLTLRVRRERAEPLEKRRAVRVVEERFHRAIVTSVGKKNSCDAADCILRTFPGSALIPFLLRMETSTLPSTMNDDELGIEGLTDDDAKFSGSRFGEVRDAVFANPYQKVWGAA